MQLEPTARRSRPRRALPRTRPGHSSCQLEALSFQLEALPLRLGILALWLGTLAAPLAAGAAVPTEIEGVSFPASVQAGEAELPLFGTGLLRYRVLFRGYVGGLYLPPNATAAAVGKDVPKALELSYFWAIKGKLFGEAATELLVRQHGPERVRALKKQLDAMHALYRDVEVGDRYRLTYVPGRGTELRLNGELLGTVPGADFARDYFGIWLGRDPLNADFRDAILKSEARR